MGSRLCSVFVSFVTLNVLLIIGSAGIPGNIHVRELDKNIDRPNSAGGLLSRIARAHGQDDAHSRIHTHIFDHIMHEVDKGHVTGDSMHHWWSEINHDLNKGTLTHDQVDSFYADLKQKYPHFHLPDECCPFG